MITKQMVDAAQAELRQQLQLFSSTAKDAASVERMAQDCLGVSEQRLQAGDFGGAHQAALDGIGHLCGDYSPVWLRHAQIA